MKRILFLDIDGVFNSDKWYGESWCSSKKYEQGDFDPEPVEIYNRLIATIPDLEVVISSSKRSEKNLQEQFDEAGLKVTRKAITPYYNNRGREILEYLNEVTEPYQYCILDDLDDGILLYHGRNHFVRTSSLLGLTEEGAKKVRKKLKVKDD